MRERQRKRARRIKRKKEGELVVTIKQRVRDKIEYGDTETSNNFFLKIKLRQFVRNFGV